MRRRDVRAFTLVELMVATAILMLLLGVLFVAINETGKIWRRSSDKIEAFQDARGAFETMTRTLSQATLNTYYEYFDSAGRPASDAGYSGTPSRYGRQSDLHFVAGKSLLNGQVGHAVFFQAPLGEAGNQYAKLDALLNACGFFIRFGDDASTSSLSGRPPVLDASALPLRYRFRLMEMSQPAEQMKIYNSTGTQWFTDALATSPPKTRVLAENIVALVILPKQPDTEEPADPTQRIGADYEYDTRTTWSGTKQPATMNQLCPVLKIVMIAIDETSALRLQGNSSSVPDLGYVPDSVFRKASELTGDLAKVEAALSAKHIGYRVFQTEIPLRNSKWSTQ